MKYVDLTMMLNEEIPVYPGDSKPIIVQSDTIRTSGWNEKEYTLRSHHGTHIDFPLHIIENGKTQNDYKIDKFIGNGKVFDVRGKKQITEDLKDIKEGDIVLFCTGCSKFVKDFEKYHNTAPTITEEFAIKLVEKKVKIIGLDTWSADKGKPFPIHKKLLSNDVLIIEGLVNLEELLGKKFKIFIAPLKLDNFDGSPCRVFAEVE